MAQFDRAIPPGGEGKVTLKINLKGYQGNVKKTATVLSNDPQNQRASLVLQGNVKAQIDVQPSTSIAFQGDGGSVGGEDHRFGEYFTAIQNTES